MFSLPQVPDYNALHVLVIHFPLALLTLVVPLLIGLALVVVKHSKLLAAVAGSMLVIGTGLCYLAQSTGEAASDLAQAQGVAEDQAISDTLSKHADYAFSVTQFFTFFTAAFLVYLLVISLRKTALPAPINAGLLLLFLAGNAALALALANTAHLGGELVHTHGILAPLEPGAGRAALEAASGSAEDAAEHSESVEHEPVEESTSDDPETDDAT